MKTASGKPYVKRNAPNWFYHLAPRKPKPTPAQLAERERLLTAHLAKAGK